MPDEFERPGRELETVSDEQVGDASPRKRARAASRDLLDRAVEKKDELKQRANTLADDRRTGVADRASSISRALHGAADTLRDSGEPQLSDWVHEAAGQVERVAGYLQGKRVDGMADDLEGMARSNPALFLGGTYMAGLALGRFLRATSPEHRQSSRDDVAESFTDQESWDRTFEEGTSPGAGNLGSTGWSGVGVAPGAFGASASEQLPSSRSRGESGLDDETTRGGGSGSETDVFGVSDSADGVQRRDFRTTGSSALGDSASSERGSSERGTSGREADLRDLGRSPMRGAGAPDSPDLGRSPMRGTGAPDSPDLGDRDVIQTDRDLHEAPPREDGQASNREHHRGV